MIPISNHLTADYADGADKGTGCRDSVSAASASSAVKNSGWLGWLAGLFTTYGGEIEVRIAPNAFGGLSLFPANDAARDLFGGDEPTGNFATHADARKRVAWNCWKEAA